MTGPAKHATVADPIGNFRDGMLARGATLVVPALLAVLALAGVSTGPVLEKGERELALLAAQQRVATLSVERQQFATNARDQTQPCARAALAKVREMIPSDCSPVLANGLIRAAASQCDMSIAGVEVGADRRLGVADTSDRIVARMAAINGQTTLAGLRDFIAALRGLGFPTTVLSVTVLRNDAHARSFEFRLGIGLLHYAPLAPSANSSQSSGQG